MITNPQYIITFKFYKDCQGGEILLSEKQKKKHSTP